jgi:diguanylate cyclase (GGDEF)-like protein
MRLTSSHSGSRAVSTPPLRSPAWSLVVVIAGLLLVFALDRASGSTPVQHLYYLPIIFAGISFRMRGGVVAALVAILLYHLANPHLLTFLYEESDFVQIVLFIAVGVIAAKLTDDARRLQALAMTDDLTGLHNLRSFEARLAATMRASRDAGTPVCMLVLDVDRLKSLNDKHGHLTGAEAVRTVGHLIAGSLPATSVACRYGGDEFAVVLPSCTESQAAGIADELCRRVNVAAPVLAGLAFPSGTLSISVGLACHQPEQGGDRSSEGEYESGEALFRAADGALYRAKETGRNHAVVAGVESGGAPSS